VDKMIKAVFFDLWDTLVTGGVSQETLYTADKHAWEYLHNKGYSLSFEEYRKRKSDCFIKYEKVVHECKLHMSPETAFKEFMFKDIDITEEDLRKLVNIHEIYDFYWDLSSNAEQVLKVLKGKGCKIALVTNSWLRQSIYMLKKSNLYDYFDAIIISCDLGFGKPDRRIFEIAAEKLDVKLSECVHVGDKHVQDIVGAYEAGIKCTIAIEPFNKKEGLAPPTAVVKNLSEIVPIIFKN